MTEKSEKIALFEKFKFPRTVFAIYPSDEIFFQEDSDAINFKNRKIVKVHSKLIYILKFPGTIR